MFKPVSLYIAFRYLRAKRRNRFISFISLVSVLGIALGVMVLLTVLSVMNGFDDQIKLKLFTIAPHITITGDITGTLPEWKSISQKTMQIPEVFAAAPYVEGQGLLVRNNSVKPVFIKGVVPMLENKVSGVPDKVIEGSFNALKPGEFGIVLGDELANGLGVMVHDKINLLIPDVSITPVGVLPRYKRFTVVGIFHVGSGFGFDSSYAFIQLQDAQALFNLGSQISGVQLKLTDLFVAPKIALSVDRQLGYRYHVSNWTNLYGPFYHAVQMEKTMMFFILILLIAIAAFNLVSGLVMLVNDKKTDIAILRTFGATPQLIMDIFVWQGVIVGVTGILLGLLAGTLLSLNVTNLVNFIQALFHVELFTPGVYWVDYLPSQLQWSDVWHIGLVAMAMSLVATIYPALNAAKTKPVEALRYE